MLLDCPQNQKAILVIIPITCIVCCEYHIRISYLSAELVPSDVEPDRIEPPTKRAREEETFTETITIDWNDDNVKV